MKRLLQTREYGSRGPTVIVLHGGPAAAGSAGPIARGLAGSFHVLEPWQRGSGEEPLTVARHMVDLHELIEGLGGHERPGLVGWSWGAMLALAYAAEHPDSAGSVVLVGCGTFDPAARARMREILDERMDDELRERIERLEDEYPDPGERLEKKYELLGRFHDYDATLLPEDDETPPFDMRAHTETWNDMLRLQKEGVYPAAFSAIKVPVLMLHGAYDPHPGTMIRDSLLPFIPHLEYREWERCGHRPWVEREVGEDFFAVLGDWLGEAFA
jgi:pimeloyl-ACP methyl ester carboxylesterase